MTALARSDPAAPAPDGLSIEAVSGPAALRPFLELPQALYRDDPNWVPPLLLERWMHLDPRKNPFFQTAEVAYWLARRAGRPVGRISAQVNRAHLERYGDATGNFGFLEAEDDPEVFAALTATAEAWLRARGMKRVTGPFTLSINDESGLLVAGFETPPYLMMNHAPPYYAQRLEALGYRKAKDLIAYHCAADFPLPRAAEALLAKAGRDESLRVRPIDRSNFRREIAIVVDIFNDAWSENWGFLPFSEAEVEYMAENLKPILAAGGVAIAEVAGEPAAMAVTLPNVNEAIRDLGGRLLPFGWLKLLWRLKVRTPKGVRMPLMGVRRRYHGTPLGGVLGLMVIEQVRNFHRARGVTEGELSWILEDNEPTRHLIESLGGRAYKTYRIYEKALA